MIDALLVETLLPTVEAIPLWHERWPAERVRNKAADMGPNAARRAFGQQPVADGHVMFPSAVVDRALDRSYSVADCIEAKSRFARMRVVAGLDIASGTSNRSAYWVLTIIGVDRDSDHRYVLSMARHRGITLLQQVDVLRDTFDDFGFDACGVESNGVQGMLVEHFGTTIPTRPIYTGASKHSETFGIPSMAAEFERGLWHIPWGDARSTRIMEPLIAELKSYPAGKFTDTVMSLYFARQMALQKKRPEPRFVVLR